MTVAILSSPALADELRVGAQVDRTEVATGEVLTYRITIAGPIQETPKVELNSFEGFQVVSTGQSQQIQVKTGQVEQALDRLDLGDGRGGVSGNPQQREVARGALHLLVVDPERERHPDLVAGPEAAVGSGERHPYLPFF